MRLPRGPGEEQRLELGPDVIARLIPHRRPLLMVDRVRGVELGERPTLWACRHISANEPVFEGHFPGLHLWPGIFTQEGLGQSSLLVEVLMWLVERARELGFGAEAVCAALANLERGHRLHPGFDPEGSRLLDTIGGAPPLGLSGSVQIRFVEPVFAGQTLEYCVRRTQRIDGRFARSEVEAHVDGRLVADGVLVGVVSELPLPALPPSPSSPPGALRPSAPR
jgi:3-hydroxyacyl-[acyl-carrier-protein] dehydratase